jgi:hypothetical protein
MALSALYSCQKPTTAFRRRRAKMIQKSSQWWIMAERTAAASIIQGMGPPEVTQKLEDGLVFFFGDFIVAVLF